MKTELCADGTLLFWCPGCETHHGPIVNGSRGWTWNQDRESPTIQPSILVTGTEPLTEDEYARVRKGEAFEPRPLRCHSFVTAGRIQFLDDCTHALKGQTVDLPEMP